MTTTQHTNGPWNHKEQWGYYKIHSEDEGVSVVHGIDSKSEANARLIAAAPDMLSALDACVDVLFASSEESAESESYARDCWIAMTQARKALAKAKGTI
jgi:hypothetical protein